MNTHDFSGLSVALATPFGANGAIDEAGFRRLVRHVVGGGADVLVVLGSTGEAATLEEPERDALIRWTLEEAQGRPVVAGCGSSATAQAARWCARAQELGCTGALVVTPPYNKPMPAGILAHFEACAKAAPGLPLIVYNVPGRTGQNLSPQTLARLWKQPQVIAVKESSGDLGQIAEIARALPTCKTLLAGDDPLALSSIAVGAQGLVSVMGNILPREAKALVDAARAGDLTTARQWQHRLRPVIDALFCESNPIPLKAALAELGIAGDAVRLPLTPPEATTRTRIQTVLEPFRNQDHHAHHEA
ncbi:MAG: 4-hydroxy-tetrahydrodipicolinate synthase [Planctomycetes bacterium]|nr:4-hydroxy-tetrahydrodipicolinate synthase [Planctomycetota bacterium]